MMRTLLSGLILAAGIGAFAMPAQAQAQTPKFGYINSQRIIAEAPGAQEARQTMEQRMTAARQELEALEDTLQTMVAEYEKQQVMLSPDARKQREDAIRQKQAAYQQRATQLEQQVAQRQQELVQPIMDRIESVLSELRKEGNYAFIFDQAAGAIVAADPALDLTPQVLQRLKAMAAAPASPSGAK